MIARRVLTLGPVLLLALAAGSAAVRAGEYTGNVNFVLGEKMLEQNDWEPVDTQAELAALVSWGAKSWPVQIAIDVVGTSKTKTVSGYVPDFGFLSGDLEGTTSELDFGVRKVWEAKNARPFVGGGLALVRGEVSVSSLGVSVSVDDSSMGFWIDGGVFWRLGRRFNIGFEARISRAKIEPVSGLEMEAGGEHVGMILGWGW